MAPGQKSDVKWAIGPSNYQDVATAFIRDHGGAVIALADGQWKDMKWQATVQQWGAWRAYFKERGIKITFMDHQGQAGKSWTVPAQWPHEFDSEATVQGDYEAGAAFARNYRPPRLDLADAAQRVMTARRYREHKRPPVPADHLKPAPHMLDARAF